MPELPFLVYTLLNASEIERPIKQYALLIYNKCPTKGQELQASLHVGDTEEDPKWILSDLLFLQRAKGLFNP